MVNLPISLFRWNVFIILWSFECLPFVRPLNCPSIKCPRFKKLFQQSTADNLWVSIITVWKRLDVNGTYNDTVIKSIGFIHRLGSCIRLTLTCSDNTHTPAMWQTLMSVQTITPSWIRKLKAVGTIHHHNVSHRCWIYFIHSMHRYTVAPCPRHILNYFCSNLLSNKISKWITL